jgi:hypothetical protein
LVQFGDDTYGEKRAVEKLFRCVLEKYKQMARSIESLLDLSTMTIEEALGRLKVVDSDEPQRLSGPSPLAGSSSSLRSNGLPAKVIGRRGSLLPRQAAASVASVASRAKMPRQGREDVPRVMTVEAHRAAPLASKSRHEMTLATTAASLVIGPRIVDSHDAARPRSRRRRSSRLCSLLMRASNYLQRHRPRRLSSTLTSQKHMPSSATAPATIRPTGGSLTPAPPTT